MSGIRVNQSFNNPNLPSGGSLADAILADANVLHWFQADANHVSEDGSGIVSFLDRKGSAAAFVRNAAANSPGLESSLFGAYAGARFKKSEGDRCALSGSSPNLALPYTWAGVARLDTNDSSANLLSAFTNSTTRSIVQVAVGSNQLGFRRNSASALVGITLGQPFAFIASYDGTNIKLSVGGTVISAAAGAAATSTAAIRLGSLDASSQFWDGAVGDVIMCGIGVLDGSEAGNALAKKIRDYFETVYGLVA